MDSAKYPHRTALSANGDRMTVWMNHADSNWQIFYAYDNGEDLLETGTLSPPHRNSGYGLARTYAFDVAAGSDGNFAVAWLDESESGTDGRLNLNRFTAGSGWDHAPGELDSFAATPTIFAVNESEAVLGYNGVNIDVAPSGDAAVSVSEGDAYFQSLSLYYHELDSNGWSEIALDQTVVNTSQSERVRTFFSPAMEMDLRGNILLAYATRDNSSEGLHYAVYDAASQNWGSGRRTIAATGLPNDIRVTVDRTRDLTDSSSSDLRGLAGIAWSRSNNVHAAIYYNDGSGFPLDSQFNRELHPDLPNSSEMTGFDLADGEGHLAVTWRNTVTNNHEMVHFWFEDADQDGLMDSAQEPLEAEGRQVAGWKLDPIVINDASILNSPYQEGDVSFQNRAQHNLSQLGIGQLGGVVVWPSLNHDALHVRRILGFDADTQSIVLEGDATHEIPSAAHHTLEVAPIGTPEKNAYFGATANVNETSGNGAVLYRSLIDGRLQLAKFDFEPTPPSAGITVTPVSSSETTESGNGVAFLVVLDKQPTDVVAIAVTSSDPTEGVVDTPLLLFDATTWNTPQIVTVTGVDDTEIDGDIDYSIVLDPVGSVDVEYAALATSNVILVNLDNENQPPSAGDDSYSVNTAQTLQVSAPGLLANDSDTDGDGLTVSSTPLTQPLGDLTLFADGSFAYTPPVGFTGMDSFTYEVSDGNGGNAEATVSIEVMALPAGSATDIYVWDIGQANRRRGNKTDLRIEVDVNRDSNADGLSASSDAGVAQVAVTVQLRNSAGNLIGTYSGLTDENGVFRTNWISGLSAGEYTAEVIDLAHASLDWNHLLDLGFDDEDRDGDGLPDDVLALG
jgi:hypothetical protein